MVLALRTLVAYNQNVCIICAASRHCYFWDLASRSL